MKLDIQEAETVTNKCKIKLVEVDDKIKELQEDINALVDDIDFFMSDKQANKKLIQATEIELVKLQNKVRACNFLKLKLNATIKSEKATIKRANNLLNYFKNEYSYTDEDIEKAKIPTPEQLKADYEKDLADIESEKATWTQEHTNILLLRAKELDKLRKENSIPLDSRTGRPITGKQLTEFLATKLTPFPSVA